MVMMNNKIIKLKPRFYSKIWGGDKLKEYFKEQNLPPSTGEAWIIAAHGNGDTIVDGGRYGGRALSDIFVNEPELFGKTKMKRFPLLVKFIDAETDLSVQVHPHDDYARTIGESYGKEEAWFVLESSSQKIQLGHNAKTKEEFSTLIATKKWTKLLNYQPINKFDLVPVLPGTLHAILGGTFVLEIQQSSDTTYRVYDYDRTDSAGNKRELHVDEALSVTNIPDQTHKIITTQIKDNKITKLWAGNYFTLKMITTTQDFVIKKSQKEYILLALISGSGEINGQHVKAGDGLIAPLPVNELSFSSSLQVMLIYPK